MSSSIMNRSLSSSIITKNSTSPVIATTFLLYSQFRSASSNKSRYGRYNIGDESRWSNGNTGYEWKQRALEEARGQAVDYMVNVTKRTPIHEGVRMKAKQNQQSLIRSKAHLHVLNRHEKESPANIIQEASRLSATQLATTTEEMLDAYDDLLLLEEEEDDEMDHVGDGSSSSSKKKKFDYHKIMQDLENEEVDDDDELEDDFDDTLQTVDRQLNKNNQYYHNQHQDDDETNNNDKPKTSYEEMLEALGHIPKEDLKMLCEDLYGEASEAADENRDKMLTNWFKLRQTKAPHTIFAGNLGEERNMWTPWYLKHELK